MLNWRIIFVTLWVVGWSGAAVWGWGPDGHKIVARIAEKRLTPEAQKMVNDLLDPQTMTEVSTWADEVRSKRQYRWSAPLHYSNVPPEADEFNLERDCPSEGCVVQAVINFSHTLRDSSADENTRQEAMKFLIHFVGDLHQPMHLSYEKDRGGNDIEVTFLGKKANLHEVWDIELLEQFHQNWEDLADELGNQITDEEFQTWSTLDPQQWATESFRYAKEDGYAIPESHELDQAYIDRALPIIKLRFQQGGVRLAVLLNAIADPTQKELVFTHQTSSNTATGLILCLLAILVVVGTIRMIRRKSKSPAS